MVSTISNEEWDKMVEEARRKQAARDEARQRQIAREKEAEKDEELRKQLMEEQKKEMEKWEKQKKEERKEYEIRLARDIARDAKHRVFYEKFLKQYHRPAKDGEFSDTIWNDTYQRLACYLVKLDGAYDWSNTHSSHLHERLSNPGTNRTVESEAGYFEGLVTKKKKKSKYSSVKLSYSEILLAALSENATKVASYLPLSKKLGDSPHEDLIYAMPAIVHLVDDNNPKDLAAFKALMISGLDSKKHPKPPNMNWRLEEALNQNIDSMDEVKLVKKLASEPELPRDYTSLCARAELLKSLIGSESMRLLIEEKALED